MPAKLLVLPLRLARYVPVILRLRRQTYDVVHIHFVTHGIVGLAIQKPFFIQAHGYDLRNNLKHPIWGFFSRMVLKKASGIFYVSPDLKPWLAEFDHKSCWLPNPIGSDFLQPTSPPRRIARVLIYCRLDPIKGVDRIFSAAQELSELVEVTALAWGSWTHEYRRRYGQHVRFIDVVDHARVRGLLEQFDAVIGQMYLAALGLCELEALAAGRVVFMHLDARPYADDPPPTVEAATGTDLVRALTRLQDNPLEIARLSAAGPDWVRRHHGFAHHADVLRQAYGR